MKNFLHFGEQRECVAAGVLVRIIFLHGGRWFNNMTGTNLEKTAFSSTISSIIHS